MCVYAIRRLGAMGVPKKQSVRIVPNPDIPRVEGSRFMVSTRNP